MLLNTVSESHLSMACSPITLSSTANSSVAVRMQMHSYSIFETSDVSSAILQMASRSCQQQVDASGFSTSSRSFPLEFHERSKRSSWPTTSLGLDIFASQVEKTDEVAILICVSSGRQPLFRQIFQSCENSEKVLRILFSFFLCLGIQLVSNVFTLP